MTSKLVDILLESDALRFGEFETKAGRLSPYFINFGNVCGGNHFGTLCKMFATKILNSDLSSQILYGPAYKGIPLAAGVSLVLSESSTDYRFAYNRKEAKKHGEGGNFVGAEFHSGDKVIIVEDVLTGGTSIRESYEMLSKAGVEIEGIIIALDREERGKGQLSAKDELQESLKVPVISIQTMSDLLGDLKSLPPHKQPTTKQWGLIEDYRSKWGSASQ